MCYHFNSLVFRVDGDDDDDNDVSYSKVFLSNKTFFFFDEDDFFMCDESQSRSIFIFHKMLIFPFHNHIQARDFFSSEILVAKAAAKKSFIWAPNYWAVCPKTTIVMWKLNHLHLLTHFELAINNIPTFAFIRFFFHLSLKKLTKRDVFWVCAIIIPHCVHNF